MNSSEALSAIQNLRDRIQKCDSLKTELETAAGNLHKAQLRKPTAVSTFDSLHKEEYIVSHIGSEPVKPKGIIKLAVPVYRHKMKAYNKERNNYNAEYDKCVASYYSEYADQRNSLEAKERLEIERDIQTAQQQCNEARIEYETAKKELDSDNTLGDKLKAIDIVDILLEYFIEQRVDTVKDAVNLYYEEEHRHRLEEYAEQQVRLTAEAAEYARQAAESAEEAAARANEAISRVESAMDRANEAYMKAEEAYDEAQNAYWATSNAE